MIERLENLVAALDDAEDEILNDGNARTPRQQTALDRISDAYGIAGEILTMIDGR
jgi:hypothetical protein